MAIPISNVTRRTVYAPSGAGGAGPYSFTFEILANTDIAVFKDDTLLTLTTHYTVVINANGTGSVTITAAGLALTPTSPTQYAIVGNRTISRSTDFTTGGDFFANTLNDELDQQTIFAQQNAEGVTRALQAPQTDPTTIDMTLPRSSVRAGKVLSFDASGNPSATEFIGSNRGNWATGTLYFVRDIVKDTSTSNIFQVTVEHTSVGAQPLTTNAEAAKYFLLVDAAAAGASATAAAASASAASTSASGASTSATNAASSASTASTQASNASTSATNAANSASAASSSATTASTAATNAGNSATSAATSATNASNSATSASGSASTATTQASNASTSATNAAASASTATTQATNAATSASGASTSASNASTSASNASTSATAAAASAASAAASFDAFDDIYLGAKASDPTVDNDGNALTTGDQYFNTTANELRVYNGSTWQSASTVGGTVTSLTVTGATTLGQNLTFTGTGNRITGDFSNGTVASRAMFQTSTTNGATNVSAIPNGTSVLASIACFDNSDTTNAAFGQIRIQNATDVRINSSITGTGTYLPMTFYTGGSERVRVDTSGNVGIGTTTTSQRFNVAGGRSRFQANADLFSLQIEGASGAGQYYIGATNEASPSLVFSNVGGTERMRIDSSGNVGIGISSPGKKLDILDSAATSTTPFANQIFQLRSNGSGADATIQFTDSVTYNSYFGSGGGNFYWNTTGAERMRIDSSGNVGIGTSSPAFTSGTGLEVQRTGDATVRVERTDATASAGEFVASSGLVKIGSTGGVPFTFITDNTERGRFDTSGNFQFNSGYGSVATAYGCRAWVNFNGTGTVAIRASGNVSSITDNGTGDYTVNFTTAMPDANYSFLAGAQANGIANGPMVDLYGNGATGSARFRVFTQASAAMDSPVCTFAAFR